MLVEHQDIRAGLVLDIKFNGSVIDEYIREFLNGINDADDDDDWSYEFAYVSEFKTEGTYEFMFHIDLKSKLLDITHPIFMEHFKDSLKNLAVEYYQKGWIINTEN